MKSGHGNGTRESYAIQRAATSLTSTLHAEMFGSLCAPDLSFTLAQIHLSELDKRVLALLKFPVVYAAFAKACDYYA